MSAIAPQKVLGILGGMGPAASAEFMRLLACRAPAEKDQEHPVVYLLSDPGIPDRTAAIEGTGDDPTKRLQEGMEKLALWGADILACPCNTAHVFIDRFAASLPAPFLHIVEETVASARAKSPRGAWLLATTGTIRSGLYADCAQRCGYSFYAVEAQGQVQRCVELVKAGEVVVAGELLRFLVEDLWRTRDVPVVTACTELPLAYAASGLPAEKNVSSLAALADACLAALYPGWRFAD
ncbi:MAG: amino acid racemase [Desulfovibrio sp.]|jgi:aspartate racemase|nr:amino acid racemase [Desulfovibrio sp.]